MAKMNENYYLRKCYMEREQVPTQSVMIKKMSPPLAKVYFKSMNRKLKVLAGLEPPMKGGGNDWYIPPEEVLSGRVVMAPINKEHLQKLGFNGIAAFGDQLVADHHKRMEAEKNKVLLESDINWKKNIEVSCRQQWQDSSKEAAEANTSAIQQAFHEFSTMYSTSITKIETLVFNAAINEIQEMREAAFQKMKAHYEHKLHSQATMLYDRYTKKLNKEKARLKARFIRNVEESRTMMTEQLHDINLEKHIVVEKLRQLLECLNLACQVYVALKEREECQKQMELSQREQQKTVKALKERIAMKDFEIRLAQEKEKARHEFNLRWKKKICAVVKKFQMFASYCLNALPEHADFFIDMEKLMLIQLNEAVNDPAADSLFEPDEPLFHTPVPKPHPFYLFCDKGYKPEIDQNLCPKHCTSSAAQLPVVIVNKRCIYAACDNFDKFTDKVTEYIHGHRGDDIDFQDHHVYEHDFPFKVTTSQQLLELKLESSIMQILQKELPNVKEVPIECCLCHVPYCFCTPSVQQTKMYTLTQPKTSPSIQSIASGSKIVTRSAELKHLREPKWESYMEYVIPKKCAKCAKRAKKHLKEHLPAYMRNMSTFDEPCLPNYETCSVATLQEMVKQAQGKRPPPPPPERVESKTRDVSTQYSDQSFDFLCTCFSDEEVAKFLQLLNEVKTTEPGQFKIVGDDVSRTYLSKRPSSFANECAYSLRYLLDDAPQLEEIFKKQDSAVERHRFLLERRPSAN